MEWLKLTPLLFIAVGVYLVFVVDTYLDDKNAIEANTNFALCHQARWKFDVENPGHDILIKHWDNICANIKQFKTTVDLNEEE